MTLEAWIEQVRKINMQYQEGAITAQEYFNAVVFYAQGVEIAAEPLDEVPSGGTWTEDD